jgi:hypothetical protein
MNIKGSNFKVGIVLKRGTINFLGKKKKNQIKKKNLKNPEYYVKL